jgi:hypothetical protein
MKIAYTVAVTFSDSSLVEDWLSWLQGGHIADVLAGGASDVEIIEMEASSPSFEIRYHFPSREGFANYEKEHAPRLRAEGLARFPAEKGIIYRRSVGVVKRTFP